MITCSVIPPLDFSTTMSFLGDDPSASPSSLYRLETTTLYSSNIKNLLDSFDVYVKSQESKQTSLLFHSSCVEMLCFVTR